MWVGFVFVVVTNIFRTTRPCSIFSQHWRFKHILQTPPATSWESAHDLIFHAEYHPITFLLHDYASFSRISRMSTPLHISRAPKWRDYPDLTNNSQVMSLTSTELPFNLPSVFLQGPAIRSRLGLIIAVCYPNNSIHSLHTTLIRILVLLKNIKQLTD